MIDKITILYYSIKTCNVGKFRKKIRDLNPC